MPKLILSFALLVTLAPAAIAGGVHANIEGPEHDGLVYTARIVSCRPADTFQPWAIAEGVVDGKPQSVLIRLKPTREHGVYRFARTWAGNGRWVIRLALGHPNAPTTLARLRPDGTIEWNRYVHGTDGHAECMKELKVAATGDEGC